MKQKGFTLLEILLVIAAIGILAAIVIVAINPNRQLAQVRDAQRRSDVNSIYKAISQYVIDTGEFPSGINEAMEEICNTGTNGIGEGTVASGCIDLRVLVPTYLSSIPINPSSQTETGYFIWQEEDNTGVSSLGEVTEYIGVNIQNYVSQSDLWMHLDAKDSNSYSGAGTTWIDISGNNNDGELINGVTYNQGSMEFDGVNDYVLLSTSPIPLTGDFTIQTWFQTTNTNKYQHIIQSYGAGNGRFTHNISPGGNVSSFYGQSSNILLSSNQIGTSRYYQGTVVREGNEMRLYLNGELIESGTMTTTTIYNGTQAIGNSPDDNSFSSRGFVGRIDKALIYTRALTEVEILQNYYGSQAGYFF